MSAELKTVKLSSLRPNPYRDLTRFPHVESLLAELQESIEAEGFWAGVQVRNAPDGKGYEIAFGHHRVEAGRRALGPEARIPVIVEDLDDGDMIRRMDRENLKDKRAFALVEIVRAMVRALADGKLRDFPNPAVGAGGGPKSSLRYAPSFVPGVVTDTGDNFPYTETTLAVYLKRTKTATGSRGEQASDALRDALATCELDERALLPAAAYAVTRKTTEPEAAIRGLVKVVKFAERTAEAQIQADASVFTAAKKRAEKEGNAATVARYEKKLEHTERRLQTEPARVAKAAASTYLSEIADNPKRSVVAAFETATGKTEKRAQEKIQRAGKSIEPASAEERESLARSYERVAVDDEKWARFLAGKKMRTDVALRDEMVRAAGRIRARGKELEATKGLV